MPATVWKGSMLLDIYDLAREGMNDKQIAKQLGIAYETFKLWKKKKVKVRKALRRGRGKQVDNGNDAESFGEYVYRRLSPERKNLFDQLSEWANSPNFQKRCDALFDRQGKTVRQHLFVQFLIAKNFNASEACRMVGISKSTLDHWCRNEPRFAEMLDEMLWHKKNYLEGGYWKLVKRGSESAILAGMRTLNSDRGFQPVNKVSVDGQVKHDHDHSVKFETLPLHLRKKVMRAIEAGKSEQQAFEDEGLIEDAELVEAAELKQAGE